MSFSGFKCNFCQECLGRGCLGQLPGMGGVNNSLNFRLNCAAWNKYFCSLKNIREIPKIRLAPMTGAIENIGYSTEEHFYYDITDACYTAGVPLSIGDGYPDYKFQYGVHAIEKLNKKHDVKASVFIKPYTNDKILERIEWSNDIASHVGVDIDSYNILTMQNLVQLENKTGEQLKEIKKAVNVPFVIKGVFTQEAVDLVKEVKPDVVVVSNHGGRIDTNIGSTADFLAEKGKILQENCAELWVDGGIRTFTDLIAAGNLGAKEVLIGRPFVTALCAGGKDKVLELAKSFSIEHKLYQYEPKLSSVTLGL